MQKPNILASVEVGKLDPENLKWVQNQLAIGGYLPKTGVDGGFGDRTLAAFNKFKEDVYLGLPGLLGPTTIKELAELSEPHPVSEQQLMEVRLNPEAGKRSGKKLNLPVVGEVWTEQWIFDGARLTWGEVTKNGSRVPKTDELVRNILHLAKVFAVIRDKANTPIAITSGYRDPDTNKRVGGAHMSQHVSARALDIIPGDRNFKKLLEILKATAAVGGIGLGQKKGFLHFDTRPNRVIWPY